MRAESAVGISGRVRAHVSLTKPRIVELLLATALPTAFLAAGGLPPLWPTVAVLVGGTLAAGAANTFNSVYDRDIDALMGRTYHRPAVVGAVSVRAGVIQGVVLAIVSALVLALLANLLSAVLALVAIAFYAVVYTMLLKRRTPQNIVWGGAAGCMPVLIAWAAVTGSLSWTPVVLFMVIFFWTPPHYWPLAMRFKDDYAAAGVPMLPVVATPAVVARAIVLYAWAMVATSLVLIPVAPMGWAYGAGAVLLGAGFLAMAHVLGRAVRSGSPAVSAVAMRLFHGSITYLALLFLLVALDPFLA
ncbi:MAG: heme o synthase [Actinomycetota bacterium]|nr:heme o synthase [Actinomycetota bacterium]